MIKKRKKSSRMHGRKMGTHGGGARKKRKGSGHRGGIGMSGSGKRADHKKTLITKLFGNTYFGKKGFTSRGTKRDKADRINLQQIEVNLDMLIKKGIAKKVKDSYEVSLLTYKILGSSKDYLPKNKMIIKAREASKSAIEKVKKSGGEILLSLNKSKDNSK